MMRFLVACIVVYVAVYIVLFFGILNFLSYVQEHGLREIAEKVWCGAKGCR